MTADRTRPVPISIPVLILVFLCGSPAVADPCAVPGDRPTIQDAADDATCTTIELGAQTYVESVEVSRALIVDGDSGGGTVLEGSLLARGSGTTVTVRDLAVSSGCSEGVASTDGAQVLADGLQVELSESSACPAEIFSDGFESGDTDAWP